MQLLWFKKEKETRFFDIDSSKVNAFNAERLFFCFVFWGFFSRFHARKIQNSQFHTIEISHSRCTRKTNISRFHATKNVIPEFTQQKKAISAFPKNLLGPLTNRKKSILLKLLNSFIITLCFYYF